MAERSHASWQRRSGACAQTRGALHHGTVDALWQAQRPCQGNTIAAGLWAAQLDRPEDVIKLEFLDFEVQRALGNVEVARDLGEIAMGGLDRRHDGLALHRFEARDGDGSRSPVWRLPRGNRRGKL